MDRQGIRVSANESRSRFFLEVRDKGEGVSDLRKPTAVSITNCVQIITDDIFLCVSLHAVCMSMSGLEYALCFCLNI